MITVTRKSYHYKEKRKSTFAIVNTFPSNHDYISIYNVLLVTNMKLLIYFITFWSKYIIFIAVSIIR